MKEIITSALIAAMVCGVGTTAGAALAVSFKGTRLIILSSIMAIAGGLMLSIVTLDLIPEAISTGGIFITLIGITIGIIFVTLLEASMPNLLSKQRNTKGIKAGLILAIGLAAHNFPEGLAIGAGFAGKAALGFELALVIGLHDIPEGAAVAAGFLTSNLSKFKIVVIAGMTAIPTIVGALIGAATGEVSVVFMTICLGFAAGTMLYITCGELIPQSKELFKGIFSTISILLGIVIGMLITAAL